MSSRKPLVILFLVLGGLAIAYLIPTASSDFDFDGGVEPDNGEHAGVDDARSRRAGEELAGAAAARAEVAPDKSTMLTLRGRVVDQGGAPIANAAVTLHARADLRSLFRDQTGRRRGRNEETGTNSAAEPERERRGRRSRRGRQRGSRDRGGERGSERFAGLREQLRMKELPGAAKTNAEGRFALVGYIPQGGDLEIRVDHEVFVPKTVRQKAPPPREQTSGQDRAAPVSARPTGPIEVGDIVLNRAARVAGIVVDEAGAPIANAKVRLRAAGRRGLAEQLRERGGFGGFGGFGRGGDNNSARTGGRRSRGNRGSGRRTKSPSVTTDEQGEFTVLRVAPGKFVADAEADKHLPGQSSEFELREGDSHTRVRIQLGIGARLVGVVLDQGGQPIAGAKVEATWSGETRRAAISGTPVNPAKPNERERGRRGNRGRDGNRRSRGRGGRGGDGRLAGFLSGRFDREEEETKTDAHGEFVLDSLPQIGFRLEVKHKDYVEVKRDPVKVAESARLEIRMDGRLTVTGVVIDLRSGQPVTSYGIEARRIRDRGSERRSRRGRTEGGGDNGRGRTGFGRRSESDPAAAARRAQRDAERKAERARIEAYLKNRLGATGEAPGRTPKPSKHAKGEFKLDGLVPGTYALDVAGPGYVKLAAAVVELEAGQEHAPLILHLPRGSVIEGQVVDAQTGEPVGRVKLELVLPALDPVASAGESRTRSEGRSRRRRGGFGGSSARRSGERVLDETRADRKGKFKFKPQLSGALQVRVEARNHPDQKPFAVVLHPERDLTGVVLALQTGGRVSGRVLGVEKGGRVTLRFTHTDGSAETARVDRNTLEYEIKGLKAGGYFVAVEKGSQRGSSRRGFGRRGGRSSRPADPNAVPHVTIRNGDDLRYDAGLEDQHLGTVAGMITLNNEGARGFEVRLQARPDPAADTNGTGRRRRSGGRSLTGRIGTNGAYSIEKVPPGNYLLSVSSSGRGGGRGRGGRGSGGSSTLHREEIRVPAGRVVQASVALSTGKLKITVQMRDTGEPAARAQVTLVLAAQAAGKESKKWRELPSYLRLTSRRGSAEAGNIKVGTYAYEITGRGIEKTTGQLTVLRGAETPLIVQVAKGDSGTERGRGREQIMKQLDKNGDGKLTRDELGERFADRFMRADKNGDGALTKDELEALGGGRRGGDSRGGTDQGKRETGSSRRR